MNKYFNTIDRFTYTAVRDEVVQAIRNFIDSDGYQDYEANPILDCLILEKKEKEKLLDFFKKKFTPEDYELCELHFFDSYKRQKKGVSYKMKTYTMGSSIPNLVNTYWLSYSAKIIFYKFEWKSEYASIEITKLEDDWFYLQKHGSKNTYYKCDGFVGLLKCLQEIT